MHPTKKFMHDKECEGIRLLIQHATMMSFFGCWLHGVTLCNRKGDILRGLREYLVMHE